MQPFFCVYLLTSFPFLTSSATYYMEAIHSIYIRKMISIPIGEIYAQVVKSATSYYSLIVLPLTNFTLHPLTCCVIDKGIKGLV